MTSVIGIDFGNDSCYVAIGRKGGIETVDNDYSLRATPSYVAFWENTRVLGVAAKNRHTTNLKNTFFGFKRLLGKKFDDPMVEQYGGKVPFNIVPKLDDARGLAAVTVNYFEEQRIFSAEQITGMLFTKLKMTTEAALQNGCIGECVVSVPSYFTAAERQSLLIACGIGGLEVLELMKETTAVALNYGLYKLTELPELETSPRNVIFVDFGHSALQVSACAFNRGELKVLATTSDPFLGGRNFDDVLAKHFCKVFTELLGIEVTNNQRAYVRLMTEVEKLKKQMSANSTRLQLNIEALMEDKDVSSSLAREEFERLAAELFFSVEEKLLTCLKDSGLQLSEIHSVEIVGGSTRIPAIKRLIEKVFHMSPSTTLNQDEAVARGCALQCAILSPKCIVRDFKIIDETNGTIPTTTQEVTSDTFDSLIEQEIQMINQDKQERDRIDTKNALEEFVYEIRVNLDLECGEFRGSVSHEQRTELLEATKTIEQWLYDEGKDELKSAYLERLKELQALENPIRERIVDDKERSVAFQTIGDYLKCANADLELMQARNPEFAHLTDLEISMFQDACRNVEAWLLSQLEVMNSYVAHLPSPVKAADVYEKYNAFKMTLQPIINKPIPSIPEGPEISESEEAIITEPPSEVTEETKTEKDQDDMDIDVGC